MQSIWRRASNRRRDRYDLRHGLLAGQKAVTGQGPRPSDFKPWDGSNKRAADGTEAGHTESLSSMRSAGNTWRHSVIKTARLREQAE